MIKYPQATKDVAKQLFTAMVTTYKETGENIFNCNSHLFSSICNDDVLVSKALLYLQVNNICKSLEMSNQSFVELDTINGTISLEDVQATTIFSEDFTITNS